MYMCVCIYILHIYEVTVSSHTIEMFNQQNLDVATWCECTNQRLACIKHLQPIFCDNLLFVLF